MVAKALLERMTPMAVDAAISVQKEIVKRSDEADKLLSRTLELCLLIGKRYKVMELKQKSDEKMN